MNNKCKKCKNLQQSVYMKLEDETLYSIWCKVGNMENETCDKFVEKHKIFKADKVTYHCDKCGEEVKYSGNVLLKNPPIYEHICKCGEVYHLDKHYPTLEFK